MSKAEDAKECQAILNQVDELAGELSLAGEDLGPEFNAGYEALTDAVNKMSAICDKIRGVPGATWARNR